MRKIFSKENKHINITREIKLIIFFIFSIKIQTLIIY